MPHIHIPVYAFIMHIFIIINIFFSLFLPLFVHNSSRKTKKTEHRIMKYRNISIQTAHHQSVPSYKNFEKIDFQFEFNSLVNGRILWQILNFSFNIKHMLSVEDKCSILSRVDWEMSTHKINGWNIKLWTSSINSIWIDNLNLCVVYFPTHSFLAILLKAKDNFFKQFNLLSSAKHQ